MTRPQAGDSSPANAAAPNISPEGAADCSVTPSGLVGWGMVAVIRGSISFHPCLWSSQPFGLQRPRCARLSSQPFGLQRPRCVRLSSQPFGLQRPRCARLSSQPFLDEPSVALLRRSSDYGLQNCGDEAATPCE